MIELVLGGARSGKSRYAERQAVNSGLECIYLATAQALDAEMGARILLHQQQREGWVTVEEPLNLAQTLRNMAQPQRCIMVDCLTLWLSNCLHQEMWAVAKAEFLACLPTLPGSIILVSNEVGSGIVPLGELTRQFVDESGWLHQAVAGYADKVTWVVAGLPQVLKDNTRSRMRRV